MLGGFYSEKKFGSWYVGVYYLCLLLLLYGWSEKVGREMKIYFSWNILF